MLIRDVSDSQSSERRQRRFAEDPSFRDPCSRDEDLADSVSPIRLRRPGNIQFPDSDCDRRDDIVTCTCCVEDLARLIRKELRRGDTIGVTRLDQSAIYVGTFLAIEGTVLVVSNLFLDNTVSFIPLCNVDSVEIGCGLVANGTASPRQIAAPVV